jgi:peptide/nickel transport system ATP-binding protein/oligopeptide transport system ATP-binding protein
MTRNASPLLQVRELTKVYRSGGLFTPKTTMRAVDGVSFDINPGETLALVGESGCGKTTVGRMILRLLDATSGSVRFDGEELTSVSQRAMRPHRSRMQIVFQDPYSSLNPRLTIGQTLAEPMRLHTDLTEQQIAARTRELLQRVGLSPDHLPRYPHQFSGGQRQRICIARALAPSPRLIVCDEPVSALDVSVQAQVVNLLMDLQRQMGLALLFISHDLGVVRHIADRVAVMYLGKIVETGTSEAIFRAPRHPYTQALLLSAPARHPDLVRQSIPAVGEPPNPSNPPPGCHFHPRCAHAVAQCARDIPQPQPASPGHAVSCLRWQEIAVPPELEERLDSQDTALSAARARCLAFQRRQVAAS